MPTESEQARMQKSQAYFDELSQAFDPIVGNYNSNFVDDVDRIHRIDPKPLLKTGEIPEDGRVRLFQRKTCFLKVILEGSGSILFGWGYWTPGTGDVVFPEVNRLQLDPSNCWQLYRYHEQIAKRDHIEGANTLPYTMAKTLVERLAQISAVEPEISSPLAL